jgi:hypothetical protein
MLRPGLLGAGLAALALTATTGLAGSAVSAKVLKLGKVNKINAKTELRGGTSKPLFLVRNTKGPPLSLMAPAGKPPLTVNSPVAVTNLNADLVDGHDSGYFLPATGTAANAGQLEGHPSSYFLSTTGKAADSDKLDGIDSTGFYAAGSKVADSDKLDGIDSTGFYAAGSKVADSDKLDGIDSTVFGDAVFVLGSQFSPRKSTSTYDYVSNGTIYQNGGTDFRFQAPLYLPQGAQVTKLTFYFVDTAAQDETLWLTRYIPGTSNQDQASVTSSGSTAGLRTASVTGSPITIIDNSTYAYILSWGTGVATSANQLAGAKVEYTVG